MEKSQIDNIVKELVKETVETLLEIKELQLLQNILLENYINQLKIGDEILFLRTTERCIERAIERSLEKVRYLKFLNIEISHHLKQLKGFN